MTILKTGAAGFIGSNFVLDWLSQSTEEVVSLDIAVDIRESSPTWGQYVAEILSSDNKKQLYIPEGFAHGFLTLSETTEFCHPESERCILWSDATLSIKWPENLNIQLSPKDLLGQSFKSSELFPCKQ
jgi:dTDP-4-dehydrorhamnose 3,5-epimerase